MDELTGSRVSGAIPLGIPSSVRVSMVALVVEPMTLNASMK